MQARVKLTPSTRKQTSAKRAIIEWMQKHPNQCRNTSAPHIARSMQGQTPFTVSTVRQTIPVMVKENMLIRTGTTKRGTYRVNYLHKDLLNIEEIQCRKNAEEAEFVEKTLSKLKEYKQKGEKAHLDTEGCIVTKLSPQSKENKNTSLVPIKPVKHIPVVYKDDEKEQTTVETPITITKDKNGINLSINLTINF